MPDAVWTKLVDADANSDAAVTQDELADYLESLRESLPPLRPFGHGGHHLPRPLDVDSLFDRADTNDDGSLTEDEVPSAIWEFLVNADADESGGITLEELDAYQQQAKERVFAELDANSDGGLTRDEVPSRLWARLSKADADDDGSVTLEEIEAYKAAKTDNSSTSTTANVNTSNIVERVAAVANRVVQQVMQRRLR